YDGREVPLTPLELKLLSVFVRHPRQVLSREQLLELVWGDAYGVSGDQVKLYVGYLRRKLDPDQPDRVPVETVRGFGYRYQASRKGEAAAAARAMGNSSRNVLPRPSSLRTETDPSCASAITREM